MEEAKKLGLSPFHRHLTDEETEVAFNDLTRVMDSKRAESTYPQVIRNQTDKPVANQAVGLTSFFLFKKPFIHKETIITAAGGSEIKETSVLGFFKLRGNYVDEMTAKIQSSNIIKEQDSKNKILLAPVGSWLPITEADFCVRDKLDVKTEKESIELRDKKAKKKQAKQERKVKELRERVERIKDEERDESDQTTTLGYYTGRRVTEMQLFEYVHLLKKKLAEAEEKLYTVRVELKRLDSEHPTYDNEWLEEYNKGRKAVSASYLKPSEENLLEYKNFAPENKDA